MQNGRSRAQSAMEYLMTYGWAILIILVVLGILYLLHVFTPGALLGNQCNVLFKFDCQNLVLATNGSASFILGQNTGTTEYNIAVACTEGTNATGGPLANTAPWVYLNATGAGKSSYNSASAYELQSGTALQVNNTPCYGSTGALLGSQQFGTSFTGIIWLKYTTGLGTPGGGNGYVLTRIATISVTVGKSGAGAPPSNGISSTTTTIGISSTTTTIAAITETFDTGSNTIINAGELLLYFNAADTSAICSGADEGGGGHHPISPVTYSVDTEDSWSGGIGPYTAIGPWLNTYKRVCAATAPGENIAMTAIGFTNAPAYTLAKSLTAIGHPGMCNRRVCSSPSETITLTYTTTQANSFVVLTLDCGAGFGCRPAWPPGCTQDQLAQVPISGTEVARGSYDKSYLATCQVASPGSFSLNVPVAINLGLCSTPSCNVQVMYPFSAAAYIYPNYIPSGS